MVENEIPKDLARAVTFHGHLCPGLVTGYLAARIGMERLGAARAEDEELIAIVENDSCAVDAVQVLTGCTLGKGNLFLRDYGKMVFTFALRGSGRTVRVGLKHLTVPETKHGPEDSRERRSRRIQYLLRQPSEELFSIREGTASLPDTARVRQSVVCGHCGEMVMETRTRSVDDSCFCIPCAEEVRGNSAPAAEGRGH